MGGAPFLQNTDFKKSFLELFFSYIPVFFNVEYRKIPRLCCCFSFTVPTSANVRLESDVLCFIH